MGSTLATLHRLQVVETQLADLRNRISAKWRAVKSHEKKLAQLEAQQAAQHQELQARQVELSRLELEIRTRDADIARLRSQLNQAKTNKEYAATLTQLNTAKVDSSGFEESALRLMGQVDELKRRAAELSAEHEAEAARVAELRAAAQEYEAQCQERLAELTRQRAATAAGVPDNVLALFERVASKNDGHALAMVIRTSPKREEFACESCNMAMTLQQVNSLLSRDEPVLCNTCGHILYLEPAATAVR